MQVDPGLVRLAESPQELDPSYAVPVVVREIEGDFELVVEFCLAPDMQPQNVSEVLTLLGRDLGTRLAVFQESDDPYEVMLFESDGRLSSGFLEPEALERDEYRLERVGPQVV